MKTPILIFLNMISDEWHRQCQIVTRKKRLFTELSWLLDLFAIRPVKVSPLSVSLFGNALFELF